MSAFLVGQRVRVLDEAGAEAFVGMVTFVDYDTECCDILYEHRKPEEETGVFSGRIRTLEEFEHAAIDDYGPTMLKEFGNHLFQLKDFRAASVFYEKTIEKLLKKGYLTIGSSVIVQNGGGSRLPAGGMISDIEEGTGKESEVEVVLLDDQEIKTCSSHLQVLPRDTEDLLLLRSCYLNAAKCDVKRQRKGWAVHHSSAAVAISHLLLTDATDRIASSSSSSGEIDAKKLLGDAWSVRAKTLVSAARPGLATQDCRSLEQLEGNTPRVQQLKKEIEAWKVKRARDNQRLAKDIARWVDDVMSGRVQETGGRDLEIVEDEEDDGSSAATAISGRKPVLPIEDRERNRNLQPQTTVPNKQTRPWDTRHVSVLLLGVVILLIAHWMHPLYNKNTS